MDFIIGIITLIIIYLAFPKGKELFNKQFLLYEGKKKSRFWNLLREIYSVLPRKPNSIFFSTDKITLFFSGDIRFSIHLSIEIESISSNTYILSYHISDSKLVELAMQDDFTGNPAYPNLKPYVKHSIKVNKSNLKEGIDNFFSNALSNYKSILKQELKDSYKKAELSP